MATIVVNALAALGLYFKGPSGLFHAFTATDKERRT
jgi:hypothetical protein